MHTFSRNYRWGLLCQGKRVMEWKRARRGWSTRQKPGKSLGRRWRPWLAHRSVDLPWSRKKKAPRDANYLMCLNTWKEIYTMQGKCGNNLEVSRRLRKMIIETIMKSRKNQSCLRKKGNQRSVSEFIIVTIYEELGVPLGAGKGQGGSEQCWRGGLGTCYCELQSFQSWLGKLGANFKNLNLKIQQHHFGRFC